MKTDGNPSNVIAWKNRLLDFSKKIYVMGIINITPDSFFAGSRAPSLAQALQAAEAMIAAGVDIIDVGGESTRPGSDPVPAQEETARVIPFIKELRKRHSVLVSVDTRRHSVASMALDAGADIVNTVSGVRDDDEFIRVAANADVPVVLMHMRLTPRTMQENPQYEDTIKEIVTELRDLVQRARAQGIRDDRIIIDPGIGFGKRVSDNLLILKHLAVIKKIGFPLLIGVSRKSFLGTVTGKPVEERLASTIAANTIACLGGADILRVHDVGEAVDVARLVEALKDL
jgi:dihydropteroate synthase